MLCAWSMAAGAGIGVGMVGQGLVASFGLDRGHREEEAQLELRGSARSLTEMKGTNGRAKGGKLWAAQLRFGGFGFGFCVECASDTP